MTEQDIELSRQEIELHHEETALQTELARLQALAEELERQVSGVKAVLAEAEASGASDPALTARLEHAALPEIDAQAALALSRSARAAAVVARRGANVAMREAIVAWKKSYGKLATQVQTDHQVAQALAAQSRERAAARPKPPPLPQRSAAIADTHVSRSPVAHPQAAQPRGGTDAAAQRISHRVKMQAAIDLHSDNNFFSGFSANISDGGLFIATVNLLPIGTEVDLSFSLPSGEKIAAHGVVRWLRESNDHSHETFPGMGVQFTRLEEVAAGAIARFVSEREPMFYVD